MIFIEVETREVEISTGNKQNAVLLRDVPIGTVATEAGDILIYDGTAWVPGNPGAIAAVGQVYGEAPTQSVPGSYTTAFEFATGTLRVYLNGLRQAVGGDYGIDSGTAFTFVDPPSVEDQVLVDYQRT